MVAEKSGRKVPSSPKEMEEQHNVAPSSSTTISPTLDISTKRPSMADDTTKPTPGTTSTPRTAQNQDSHVQGTASHHNFPKAAPSLDPGSQTVIKQDKGTAEPEVGQEDEVGYEANPLWLSSDPFAHRYGTSARREPLLGPPRRSQTLPIQPIPQDVMSSQRRLSKEQHGLGTSEFAFSSMASPPPRLGGRQNPSRGFKDDEAVGGHEEHAAVQNKPTLKSSINNEAQSKSSNLHHAKSNSEFEQNPPMHKERTESIPKANKGGLSTHDSDLVAESARLGSQESRRRDQPQLLGDKDRSDVLRVFAMKKNKRNDKSRPSHPPPPGADTCVYGYRDLVNRLAEHMPQLVNVQTENCRVPNAGQIVCYDTLLTGGLPRLFEHITSSIKDESRRLRDMKPDRTRNVRYRYILVEDLSPQIIDALGSTFWLNPEFFEEHLNRSGYRPLSYHDPIPLTWNTHGTPKDYVSVRLRIKPISENERDELLKAKRGSDGSFTFADQHRSYHTINLATNIFRQEWPLVSDPEEISAEDSTSTLPVAWEERVTIQVSHAPGRPPVFIVLLDPLPWLNQTTRTAKDFITSTTKSTRPLFKQAYNRAPMGPKLGLIDIFDGNPIKESTIRILGANLASTNCTREDLTSWMASIKGVQPDNTEMDMIVGLLWIIHRDVLGFLHFVVNVLGTIGSQATDDYLIQTRLAHWRNLITRFQTELPEMRNSIKSFFQFLARFQPLDQAEEFIERTLDHIDNVIEQNEKSYAALRADMALLESKRGIDQAESVGKLTELGFVFIPISCVAALFSMQVEPLSDRVPLSSFIISAVLTITVIYIIRIVLRSTALTEYKRQMSRKIRINRNIPSGASIPTRTILFYILRDRKLYVVLFRPFWGPVTRFLLFLLCLALIMLPVILLWVHNKHMDRGYKSTLTVVFLLCCAGIVGPVLQPSFIRLVLGQEYSAANTLSRRIQEAHELSRRPGSDVTDSANSSPVRQRSSNRNPEWNLVALSIRWLWKHFCIPFKFLEKCRRKLFRRRRVIRLDTEAMVTESSDMTAASGLSRHDTSASRQRGRTSPDGRKTTSTQHGHNTVEKWRGQVPSFHKPGEDIDLADKPSASNARRVPELIPLPQSTEDLDTRTTAEQYRSSTTHGNEERNSLHMLEHFENEAWVASKSNSGKKKKLDLEHEHDEDIDTMGAARDIAQDERGARVDVGNFVVEGPLGTSGFNRWKGKGKGKARAQQETKSAIICDSCWEKGVACSGEPPGCYRCEVDGDICVYSITG